MKSIFGVTYKKPTNNSNMNKQVNTVQNNINVTGYFLVNTAIKKTQEKTI